METLQLGLQEILKEQLFCDVEIRFKNGEIIWLHRLILASSSSLLRNCFQSLENSDLFSTIILPDYQPSDFRELIPYLYGSTTQMYFDVSNDMTRTLKIGDFYRPEMCYNTSNILDNNKDFILSDLPKISSENLPTMTDEDWNSMDISFGESNIEDVVPDLEIPIKEKETQQNTNEIKCNSCGISVLNLKEHLITSKCGTKYSMCSECPKVFDTPIKLIRHKVVHKKQNAPKFNCDQCQKSFLSQRILNTHLAKVHGIHIQKKFQCLKCPQSFNFENQLKFHEAKHLNVKRTGGPIKPDLFCDFCDMICTNRSALHYHLQKHTNPLHHCPQCAKSFKSEFGLDYHLKIHNNEKNHLCADCGKGFISPYKLIHHRRSAHTLEKPFVCEECGEGFIRNDKLTVHKRRAHTGEKPYVCDQCPWRGVDSSSLIHHKKKHAKQPKTE